MTDKPPWEEAQEAASEPQLVPLKPWEEAQQHAKSQLSQEAAKLPPSEEPWEMQFARGVASGGEVILRAGTQLLPGPETKALATPTEGEVTGGKVKEGRRTEATPISMLGSMAPTGAIAGAAAKTLPKAAGALARGAVGGAAGGAVQPVEGGDFWTTKAEQVATGVGLGFGFSLAGQVVTPPVAGLMRWVGRKFNPETLEDGAVSEVLGRINSSQKYGGPSATDMIDLINKSSKPLVLADVGGKPVEGLAGRAYRSGPAGKQMISGFLEARDEGAYGRLLVDTASHIYSGQSMFDVVEGLNASQKASARPLYEQADALKNMWSSRLEQFIKNSEVQKGLRLGYKLEELAALAENRPFNPHILGVELDPNNPEGVQLFKTPNLRVLDMGKRGLDSMIEKERDQTGRLTAKGRELSRVRTAYVKELDALDPTGVYKKARDTWGGYAAAKDAIEFGRTVFGQHSPEELQHEFEAMAPGNQEYARVGMADMLRERILKTGFKGDEAKAIMKNPWMQKQMTPFFKSTKDYNEFTEKVLDEQTMKATMSNTMRGSQTAERAVEDGSAHAMLRMGSALKIGTSAFHGNILRSVGEAWRLYHDFKKGASDPEFDAEVAKVLFSPDLLKTPPGIRFMQKVAEMELAKAAKGGAQSGLPAPGIIPGALGGAAAEQVAPREDILGSQ